MGTNVVSSWGQVVKLLQKGTKDPTSCADPSLFNSVSIIVTKLGSLPPPPRSVWKKLVQQLQVPLNIGTALSTAAQHSPKSPGTNAALTALHILLGTATASGLIKDGAAVGNLAISMRQQLQQVGLLQHLRSVMAALAADLRSEAAALAGMGGNDSIEVSSDSVLSMACLHLAMLHRRVSELWATPEQPNAANKLAWLCDPSGHAETAMQLCTAGLQHVSSVMQYVIPAVQRTAPQQAAKMLQDQHAAARVAVSFGIELAVGLSRTLTAEAQHQQLQQYQQQLQPLVLSPHCLPCLASMLVLHACWIRPTGSLQAASDRQQPKASSSGSTASRSNSSSSGSSITSQLDRGNSSRQPGRLQQQQQYWGEGGSSPVGTALGSGTLTACQLKLFKVLGLSPQLAAMDLLPSPSKLGLQVSAMILACAHCCDPAKSMVLQAMQQQPVAQMGPQAEVDKQRWRFEQQLWLLLPSVLLPTAYSIVLSACDILEDCSQLQAYRVWIGGLLTHSHDAMDMSGLLHFWLGGDGTDYKPPHPAWTEEVLGAVLQLADKLLLQQQQPCDQAAGLTGVPEQSSSSSGGSHQAGLLRSPVLRAGHAVCVLALLSGVLGALKFPSFRSTAGSQRPGSTQAAAGGLAAVVVPVEPALAERFVEVCTTLEAGLRVVTTAAQQGIQHPPSTLMDKCLKCSMVNAKRVDGSNSVGSVLVLHLGLRGPAAHAVEQRQLYSLLNAMHKLGHSRAGAGHELVWGQQTADMSCWDVAQAAVELLQAAAPAAGPAVTAAAPAVATSTAAAEDEAPATPAAAVEQQLGEEEYLPSLVIIGRIWVVWAEQLLQQIPDIMLPLLALNERGPPSLPQQEEQQEGQQGPLAGGVQAPYSAAPVCIPCSEEGVEGRTLPPCGLEELAATVLSWVGSVKSPAAHAALAAAAGGDPNQFKQQVEALSLTAALAAARHAVRHDGVSEATLAALVQQLQATGVMLSSIAVPHFCNNPACVDITGPTEVQLVSGRTCICAGCRTARYCGRVCQRQAWPQHKPVCKALAAAVAAADTQQQAHGV